MRKFDCNFDFSENNAGFKDRLVLSSNQGMIGVTVDGKQSTLTILLNLQPARELAAELIRLADEIEGVSSHEVRIGFEDVDVDSNRNFTC